MTDEQIIAATQELLRQNRDEWEPRYAAYAAALGENEVVKDPAEKFRIKRPLYFFVSTSQVSTKGTLYLDIRYHGQNVATLKCTKGKGGGYSTDISTQRYDANNLRDFDCPLPPPQPKWRPWLGKDARAFKNYFYAQPGRSSEKNNKEKNIENVLRAEFAKSTGKLLRLIQPVRIGGMPYGMPTPLTAHERDKVFFAGADGGGIDILARTGNPHTRLCVIEVKDENREKEPPAAALQQAIKYAVFLRELLRSGAGEAWWRLFGFGGQLPAPGKLVLQAACAMPLDGPGAVYDTSFGQRRLDAGGDTIECHYIYFTYEKNAKRITGVDSSLA